MKVRKDILISFAIQAIEVLTILGIVALWMMYVPWN